MYNIGQVYCYFRWIKGTILKLGPEYVIFYAINTFYSLHCSWFREEPLKVHIEFLESLGIAGVSHHSLLFSKTAPVPVPSEEEVSRFALYLHICCNTQ